MAKPNVREQLLEAGLRVLSTQGFNGTSVQDITDAASVPKGSFYNHFESKEALGAEVVRRYLDQASARQAALRDPAVAPIVRLRRHFEELAQGVEGREFCGGCLLGNFAAEMSEQSEMIRTGVCDAFASWATKMTETVAEAQAAGEISTAIAPDALAAFLLNSWEGAQIRARAEKSRVPMQQFLDITFGKVLAP
ncbi:MAG: TetR family transcriptional regulator C-terminal domain-containing protein [Burkholderiales bacterium]|nr:TetR family transcriptional regulator C-terminal domain-containing protein [Burkholderiales bacterium]